MTKAELEAKGGADLTKEEIASLTIEQRQGIDDAWREAVKVILGEDIEDWKRCPFDLP